MEQLLTGLYKWFWWENIWLPHNCSWANLEDRNGGVYPKPRQLFAIIPYAFGMLVIRFFVERYIAAPLADFLGVKSVQRIKPQPNLVLEIFFKNCKKKPSQAEIRRLAKKCNWTVHLVEKWFRRRRNLEIPTLHKKFQEACWRCIFFSISFVAGIIFLYDKPWFYDIWQVWVDYPFHPLLPSQYWYYMLEMSFYVSLLFTLGIDTKRKDFKAHVIHHFAALGLMFCSWSGNYVRVGTLVLLVHDVADIWLEAAKMFNYACWENTCSALFILFAVVFFITRLILFPFWILRATLYYSIYYSAVPVIAYFQMNGQLLVLQALHLYWAYLIFNLLKKFIFIKVFKVPIPACAGIDNDTNLKDSRSADEEEDSCSDAEEECVKNGSKNGSGMSKPLLNRNH